MGWDRDDVKTRDSARDEVGVSRKDRSWVVEFILSLLHSYEKVIVPLLLRARKRKKKKTYGGPIYLLQRESVLIRAF